MCVCVLQDRAGREAPVKVKAFYYGVFVKQQKMMLRDRKKIQILENSVVSCTLGRAIDAVVLFRRFALFSEESINHSKINFLNKCFRLRYLQTEAFAIDFRREDLIAYVVLA